MRRTHYSIISILVSIIFLFNTLPLYAVSGRIFRQESVYNYKDKYAYRKYFDNVFFDGQVGKEAPWITMGRAEDSQRGAVRELRYDVTKKYAGYYIQLPKDNKYNRYNALSFFIKGNIKRLKVELKGKLGHTFIVSVVNDSWQHVIIPFEDFSDAKEINPKKLKEIVFVIASNITKPKTGFFYLDSIAFVYYKRKKRPIQVKDMKVTVNGEKLQDEACYLNQDFEIDVKLPQNDMPEKVRVLIEACTDDVMWFYVDEKKAFQGNAHLFWNAHFYPSRSYNFRVRVLEYDDEEVCRSKIYAIQLQNSFDEKALLKKFLRDTFKFFLYEYHPDNYLTKDRAGKLDVISTGATGFALTVYPLAAERHFITHDEAKKRIISILDAYLNTVGHIKGFYQHWFNFIYIPKYEEEGVDSVETSFLAAGALFCALFYTNEDDPQEIEIREKAYQLINRIYWPFMLGHDGIKEKGPLYWVYFVKNDEFCHPIIGFNESLITYLMALRGPKAISYKNFKNWYEGYTYKKYEDKKLIFFRTLFTQHYSFMWLDPRELHDKWIAYFSNAQRVTLVNREYCLRDRQYPVWGVTACDGPQGYRAYGVDVPFAGSDFDGTVSPAASIGSLPFTSAPVIANMRIMYEKYRNLSYGKYGFYDGFNIDKNWSSKTYLGLTQGVIYLMIENYLDASVWKRFMTDKRFQKALKRAKFKF